MLARGNMSETTVRFFVYAQTASLNKAAGEEAHLNYFDQILGTWNRKVQNLLKEKKPVTTTGKESDAEGPDTELEFWRSRMAKFNSVTEQLNSKECRIVLGVCGAARTKNHRIWKELDVEVRSALPLLSATRGIRGVCSCPGRSC